VEFDADVGHGIKRKYDDGDDATSVDELEETLLKTCISKLSAVTAAKGSRRRRTLRHTVLINNMLRSLEHVDASKGQYVEAESGRARITARRHSSDTCLSTTGSRISDPMSSTPAELSASSVLAVADEQEPQPQELLSLSWEQKQQLEQLSLPWEPQQQLELLPFSLDTDNNEVMSSPTATFSPLLAVDLRVEMVNALSDLDTSQSELETLDISCDYNSYDAAVNFYDSLPFHKPVALPADLTVFQRAGSDSV